MARMLSVRTISSIGLEAMRATAPPESTPCVTFTLADFAPFSISARAAFTSVPPESTMSSIRMQL